MTTSLTGVACHKALPVGETVGAIFWHEGEKYYVSRAEMDRIRNLPSDEKIREHIDKLTALMKGRTER